MNKLLKIYGWCALFCVFLGVWVNFLLIYAHLANYTTYSVELIVNNLIALVVILLISIFALRKWKPIIWIAFIYFFLWNAPMLALMPQGLHIIGTSTWSLIIRDKLTLMGTIYSWAVFILAIFSTVDVMILSNQLHLKKRAAVKSQEKNYSMHLFNYLAISAVICLAANIYFYSHSYFINTGLYEIVFCLALILTAISAWYRQWLFCMLLFACFMIGYYKVMVVAIISIKYLLLPNIFDLSLFWIQLLMAYTTILFYLIFLGWVIFYIKEHLMPSNNGK